MKPLIASTALAALLASGAAFAESPDDPHYLARGSWGQDYDDQWGLRAVGFLPGGSESAWDAAPGAAAPVVVAVIDTGLDYHHPDFDRASLWRNRGERINGIDDDANGYVDDVAGWNFVDGDNNPWDRAGHGTHVAGIIAARSGNAQGIAGISPSARIMPLKVLNFLGRGRSSGIAEAIFYAVANGARVINLSLGGEELTGIERRAIEHAAREAVLVVVAAGNTGRDTADYGYAGLASVLTVAAVGPDSRRAAFSNWGRDVRIAAPGVDVLSLRARFTDLQRAAAVPGYAPGSAVVGEAERYYRASGTSFAAPFVAGVASLLFAQDPGRSAEQVARMLLQSAGDVEQPGVDPLTGYGLLDARAALAADPGFYVEARIDGVEAVRAGGATRLRVAGTADADRLAGAWLELGEGADPAGFERVPGDIPAPIRGGPLLDVEAKRFAGASRWTLRLVVAHQGGRRREARFDLTLN